MTDVMSCKNVTVDGSGNLDITVTGGLPNVFYPTKLLAGSTICNNGVTTFKAPPLSSTSVTLGPTATATGKSNPTSSSGSSGSPSGSKNAGAKASDVNGAALMVAGLGLLLAAQSLFT